VDSHTLEAVMHAVDKGVIEAYLIGDVASIENPFLFDLHPSPFVQLLIFPMCWKLPWKLCVWCTMANAIF